MAAAGKRLASTATIRELLTGREKAVRLANLLRRSFVDGERIPDEARELVDDLHSSFSNALAALESGESPEACWGSAAAAGDSSLGSEEGGGAGTAGKRKSGRPGGADRRGGQRRRSQSESWTAVPAKTLDDGYTWRKYGQKGIQSTKHPRSYYRCSQARCRGCTAKRQVQRSEEDPSMYLITYSGHHTCTAAAAAAANSAQPAAGGPFLINFGASPKESLQVVGGAPAAATAAAKQDYVEEDAASNQSPHDSSSEYLLPAPKLGKFGTDPVRPPATASVSDLGDASSATPPPATASVSDLGDVDLGVDSFPFGDMLSYLNDVQFDLRFPGTSPELSAGSSETWLIG